ncbi:MAG: S41 family peptidase [Gemmatimonadales bacterium]|jgi:carboxyl-terminal processing protease
MSKGVIKVRKSFWKPAIIGLVAVVSGGWLLQQGQHGTVVQKNRIFQEVMHHVADRYVDAVDPAELYDMAIDGLLEQLGDPHSTLLRPEDYSDLRLSTTGNYGGLGIRIDQQGDWITVVQTLPNTPAERVGLRPGDRLIEVEGESMRGWNADKAVRVLRGPKGKPVDLKIMRIGVAEAIPVRIVRDDIHVEYVTAFMYDSGVGYIRHQQFSANSAHEIGVAIESLEREGMKGLILDLRGNPGGLLEEGVAVADLFLDGGTEVVETRSRVVDQNDTYYSAHAAIDRALPVIVLVDGFSASASEIVAGALQDHDRALVVGTPTFGKGSVQTLYPLDGGNYLKLTTAKWYTPSGRSIEREDREHPMVAMRGASGSPGELSASADQKEIFYTTSGREVYGGGGITPDVTVQSEPLSDIESAFRASLGEQLAAYYDAVFRYAVAYAGSHPDLATDFSVTPTMLHELYAWLLDSGIEVDRELYDGSVRVVERELAIQLATVAFDEVASLRRRLVLDRQVETAAELLREGSTQEQLFALAETWEAAEQDTVRQ